MCVRLLKYEYGKSTYGRMDPAYLDHIITFNLIFAQGTILINHSNNAHCYPLTHLIEVVIASKFSEEICQQSLEPMVLFTLTVLSAASLMEPKHVSLERVYTPYSSPELGQTVFQATESALKADMKCGDQLLVTPNLFEDSSARITQGE